MAKRDIIEMGVIAFALNIALSLLITFGSMDSQATTESEVQTYVISATGEVSTIANYNNTNYDTELCNPTISGANCTEHFVTGSSIVGAFDKVQDILAVTQSIFKVFWIAAWTTVLPVVWGFIIGPMITDPVLLMIFIIFLTSWQIATIVALYSFIANKRGVNDE